MSNGHGYLIFLDLRMSHGILLEKHIDLLRTWRRKQWSHTLTHLKMVMLFSLRVETVVEVLRHSIRASHYGEPFCCRCSMPAANHLRIQQSGVTYISTPCCEHSVSRFDYGLVYKNHEDYEHWTHMS